MNEQREIMREIPAHPSKPNTKKGKLKGIEGLSNVLSKKFNVQDGLK